VFIELDSTLHALSLAEENILMGVVLEDRGETTSCLVVNHVATIESLVAAVVFENNGGNVWNPFLRGGIYALHDQ
jgi:hypothetical protein